MNTKIGILGGGQLGRMFLQAAMSYNYDIHVLDHENAPCHPFCSNFTKGAIQDFDEVYQFGKKVDIITIEIEKVNVEALEQLEREGKKVFPQSRVIKTIQNKRLQKQFFLENDIPTADFLLIDSKNDLYDQLDFLPAFQKLGEGGYDGRGVCKINTEKDIENGFEQAGILEKYVDFEKELSVIVARNENGEISTYPVTELVFDPELNLVDYLFAPANITEATAIKAKHLAEKVIKAFNMVGILAVEMFLTRSGELLVNEVAPRTHNSGHHTIEANYTSQFEQHLRAISNLPLGNTESRFQAGMVNLIGSKDGISKYEGLEKCLQQKGVYLHLYGKKISRAGRKMGHISVIGTDHQDILRKIKFIKENLKVDIYE